MEVKNSIEENQDDNTKMRTLCCSTLEIQKIWSLPYKEGFEFLLCSPLHSLHAVCCLCKLGDSQWKPRWWLPHSQM